MYRLASSIESSPSPIARFMSFVVTSSQMHTKHLPLPGYDGSGAIFGRPSPVTLTASTPPGAPWERTRRACRRTRHGTRLCEERVRRLPPTRRDEEVAVEALAVEDEPTHPSLAALGHELARPRVAEVDDLHDLGADGVELRRDRKRLVVAAQHDRPLAG